MDARVRYTLRSIREEFIQLLAEKPLDKITVTEICARSHINRATFYKYYDNPTDLLQKLEKDRLDFLQSQILSIENCDFTRAATVILNDVKANYDTYIQLFGQQHVEFKHSIFTLCYSHLTIAINNLHPGMSAAQTQWLYNFVANGCNGIASAWMKGGMKEPIEEVVSFMDYAITSLSSTQHFEESWQI